LADLVEAMARGHVTAVKIVVTSVLLAVAVKQAMLMAVGYGVRPSSPPRAPRPPTGRSGSP
jgi:hypothetical protein